MFSTAISNGLPLRTNANLGKVKCSKNQDKERNSITVELAIVSSIVSSIASPWDEMLLMT